MSLNPFPVTDLQPEIECTYCACAGIMVVFETDIIGQTPEFA